MRDRAYRRKQEARHYNRRLRLYSKFGNFGKSWYETGDSYDAKRVYLGQTVNLPWSGKPKLTQAPVEVRDLWRLKWTKKLRRGGVPMKVLNHWSKKKSNRILRHFMKTVPWDIPEHLHWPKRANIYRPGYHEDVRL